MDNRLAKKITEKPKEIKLSGIHDQQYLIIPAITLALIIISLFLTFVYGDGDPFVGSLIASILIVFLVLYSFKRSISL